MPKVSSKAKLNTPCGVAVPYWYVNSENFGKCLKYQAFHNQIQETNFMLCSETKKPCPLNGEFQFPVVKPILPKWMKKVAYYVEPEDFEET